jgi:RimJ/RimL family protein N-acetyltransferase
MSSKIITESSRLILRQFCLGDFERLSVILADPDVMKFSLSGPFSSEQTRKFLKRIMASYETGSLSLLAVIHKDDDCLIGYCGFLDQEIDGQREIELTYRFSKTYWGLGLATEAAKAVCQYAFEQLKLSRLISIIEAENIASIRVAEKCGMTCKKESVFHDIDVRIYTVTKEKSDASE